MISIDDFLDFIGPRLLIWKVDTDSHVKLQSAILRYLSNGDGIVFTPDLKNYVTNVTLSDIHNCKKVSTMIAYMDYPHVFYMHTQLEVNGDMELWKSIKTLSRAYILSQQYHSAAFNALVLTLMNTHITMKQKMKLVRKSACSEFKNELLDMMGKKISSKKIMDFFCYRKMDEILHRCRGHKDLKSVVDKMIHKLSYFSTTDALFDSCESA